MISLRCILRYNYHYSLTKFFKTKPDAGTFKINLIRFILSKVLTTKQINPVS